MAGAPDWRSDANLDSLGGRRRRVACGRHIPDLANPAGAARRACTIVGTPGPDRLVGTARADVICGLGGRDVIFGRGGGDILRGGRGRDVLRGDAGDDRLVSGLSAESPTRRVVAFQEIYDYWHAAPLPLSPVMVWFDGGSATSP